MDRISRLFGRRSEASEAEQKTEVQDDHVQSESVEEAIEPFGLKFSLESGKEFLFASLPISIGRAQENSIVLDHDTVSSFHAVVYFDEQAQDVCILDQDSLNGLTIDNMPTRKNILHDGAIITLGKVILSFRDTGYIHTQ